MKTLKYILLGLLGIVGFFILWGLIEPYFIDTEEEVATIPNLPEAWQGQKIAVIADFQIGMWLTNEQTVNRIVADIVEEGPAAVLITGDFIYHALPDPAPEIQQAVDLVRPLTEAGIPTYAVLGNHDYGMSSKNGEPHEELATQVQTAVEAVGIEVLQNEAVSLTLSEGSNEEIYLGGIGSVWANKSDPSAVLAEIPQDSPRILLMHNPDSFVNLPPNTAPLAVAGHTHGGQIRIPFTPEWSWLTFAKEDEVHADGWIEDYGDPSNQLYVNRGIGFSIIPIRINAVPEVTYMTLQSQ